VRKKEPPKKGSLEEYLIRYGVTFEDLQKSTRNKRVYLIDRWENGDKVLIKNTVRGLSDE